MIEDAIKIKTELAKVGIIVDDIYELVNSNKPYPEAVPVLLELLKQGIEHVGIKEGVVRALAVNEAIGKAGPYLINEFYRTSKDNIALRWAIGNTLYTTITTNDTESILQIIQDKSNGISRQMFVAALGKVKSEKAEDVLIKLLDDGEVVTQALEALGKMKSAKALHRITLLTNNPNSLIKKEAQKALKKINSQLKGSTK